MPDYQNGKIYVIRSHQTDEIYIGSTIQSLSSRMAKHRNSYKRYLEGKSHYTTSFKLIEYDDAYIELLEECKCDNKEQLHKREGELIRVNNCINKIIAGRTDKEYYQENKEKINERAKQYYQENKEKINERVKQYYQENKEKVCEYHKQYSEENKEKIKQYREENKEMIKERRKKYNEENKEQSRQYRLDNIEKIKQYRQEKINCECGSTISRGALYLHRKSKRHLDFISRTALH